MRRGIVRSGKLSGGDYAVATVIFAGIFTAALVVKMPAPKSTGGLPVVPYAPYRDTPKSSEPQRLSAAATAQPPTVKPYVSVPRNCGEARARGIAPMYRGGPGYGAHMDGDNDGIACEPYRGSGGGGYYGSHSRKRR